MNKAYRLIWSQVKSAWVIVAEIVKGNGGPPPITVKAVVAATVLTLLAARADALPTGQAVVNGNVSFATSGDGKTLTVTNSPNSIINWNNFSILAGETTTFAQQNAASSVLNRVIGTGSYSEILGALNSNGRVFLINPNGILFGAGSTVNVAGLVASSLGMTNNDFLNGNYRFTGGAQSGSVINEGAITTAAGGKVWLIAPQVENRGIITASGGDVVLAAGQSVHMIDPDNPEIAVVVSASGDKALNIGTITAAAGKVGIFGGLVSQQSVISADGAEFGQDGRIFLRSTSGTSLSSISSTRAATAGSGGSILIESTDGPVTQAGTVSASADITLAANDMTLAGGTITAPTVNLNRTTWGDIDLVGAGSKTAGILGLKQSDLNSITATDLNVGNSSTALDISITAATAVSGNLNLIANSSINQNAVLSSSAGSLSLSASSFNQAAAVPLSAANNVTITADTMNLDGTTVAPVVALTRQSWGNIELGTSYGGSTLGLTQADLDTITASSALRIGDTANTGNITITNTISRTATDNNTLHLISGGGITQWAPLAATNLALETNAGIMLNDPGNAISNLAAVSSGYGGNIAVATTGALNIGSVDGISGITAPNFAELRTDDLTISQNISAQYLFLKPLTSNRDITLGTKTAGTLSLTDPELNWIYASGGLIIGDATTGNINISAPIDLNGGGGVDVTFNPGFSRVFNQSESLSAPSIRINADTMNLSSTPGDIVAQTVFLGRGSSGAIDLGTASGGATLGITAAQLGAIDADTLKIDNIALTTGMTISAPINLLAVDNLSLATGGTFSQTAQLSTPGSITIAAGTMNLTGGAASIVAPTISLNSATSGLIDLGVDQVRGALVLNQGDMNTFKASNVLEIGNALNTFDITVGSPISLAATTPNLYLGALSIDNSAGSLTTTGSVSLTANSMSLDGGAVVAQSVNLNRATWGDINFVPSKLTPATLELTQNDLDSVSAPTLRIGDVATTGSISISAPITRTGTLHLSSYDSVSQVTTGAGLTVENLAITSGSVSLNDPANAIGTLAVSAVDAISVTSASTVTVGTVDSVAGVQSTYGDVALTADAMNLAGSTVSGNMVTLAATIGTDIALVGTKTAGFELTQADLTAVTATNLVIENPNTAGVVFVSTAITIDPLKAKTFTLSADQMDFAGGSVDNTGGTIAIMPYTPKIGSVVPLDFSVGTTDVVMDPSSGNPSTINWNQIKADTRILGNQSSQGGINIASEVNLGTGSLGLLTDGAISQTAGAIITAAGLQLGQGGRSAATAVILNDANMVDSLAANVAALSFTNAKSLDIGTVNGTDGLTVTGNTTLKVTGAATQTAPITAASLELLNGNFTLINPDNLVTNLSGNIASLTLVNNRTLTIASALTATGNIDLTATGAAGQDGIRVDAPISAANITLHGIGGDGGEWSSGGTGVAVNSSVTAVNNVTMTGYGGASINSSYGYGGGIGVAVNNSITADSGNVSIFGKGGDGAYGYARSGGAGATGVSVSGSISAAGNITVTGWGGNGGNSYAYYNGLSANGGSGGSGILINPAGSIISTGNSANSIVLEGHGGNGGYAVAADASLSNNPGGYARGGDGGIGVSNDGTIGFARTVDAYGGPISGMAANIAITGYGGYGGDAFGGAGRNRSWSDSYGGSIHGGDAIGGRGGDGIRSSGSISSDAGTISLNGFGRGGGYAKGGTGGYNYDYGPGGRGGNAAGGGGGTGLYLSGQISSESGFISLNGIGGNGSFAQGGSGSTGGEGAYSGGSGGWADGGNGGNGVILNYGFAGTDIGSILLSGTGGNGGDARGGDGGTGFGDYNSHQGGSGGGVRGGSGGTGIDLYSAGIATNSGDISLTGFGGAGGDAMGGSGGAGSSNYRGGSGGSGGYGRGGYGGAGISMQYYSTVNTGAAGIISMTGTGGRGGAGFGGDGGNGGDAFAAGWTGSRGGDGAEGTGGQGGSGIYTVESYVTSDSGAVTLTGYGGDGGAGVAGFGGNGGRGGLGWTNTSGYGGYGGDGGYGGSGGSGGYARGGNAGTGISLTYGRWGDGNVYASAADITLAGSGGAGGKAFGGSGGYGGMGADGGSGGNNISGSGGNGGYGGDGGSGGSGGSSVGGVAGNGLEINIPVSTYYSGTVTLTGFGGDGGSGFGGNAGMGAVGGAGGKGGSGAAMSSSGSIGYSGYAGNSGFAGEGLSGTQLYYNGPRLSGGHGVIINSAVMAYNAYGSGTGGNVVIDGTGGQGGDGIDGSGGFSMSIINGIGAGGGDGVIVGANVSAFGDSPVTGNIRINGTGGNGGAAVGSTEAAYSYNNSGSAIGGFGGRGIAVNSGIIIQSFASAGTVSLDGRGGGGGSARGGNGYYGGGAATGGNGGIGVAHSGTINSNGSIDITGQGGVGGLANGGSGYYTSGRATGGNGGRGIYTDYASITSSYGTISLNGTGGNGGFGNGGAYSSGGYGGRGIHLYGYNTALRTDADITIKGYGGSGGGSTGGTGGDGGRGVHFSSDRSYSNYFAVRSISGSIGITGQGGSGGVGTNGNGIHGFGVQDNWAGGEGSLQSAAATVVAIGGISLGGAVDSVTLANSGSGDIDYSDASFFSGDITVSAVNTAPFDATAASGGAVNISSDNRDLTVGTGGIAATTNVNLIASNGAISGSPGTTSITADSTQLTALNGIGATAPFQTAVNRLGATNTNNAIQLENSRALTVTGISNGGLVLLDNQGALTLNGIVESTGSTVTVTAHSPLTTNAAVIGSGTVTLFAGAAGSINDNLTINSSVTSQTGDILLKAGENIVVNGITLSSTDSLTGNGFLTAGPTGKITILSHLNPSRDYVLTTQNAALLPGVKEIISSNVVTMGKESTDLSDEENSEITGEGENHGTEFSAYPFCN